MKILMHYNPLLQHQLDHAHAFACEGNADAGILVTNAVTEEADIHIISGPHYAYSQWKDHPHVLMIDRAMWGDPDCVSIGWLNPDGSRRFATGTEPRPKPELQPWKTEEKRVLIFADYGQNTKDIEYDARHRFTYVRKRLHPADTKTLQLPLAGHLHISDIAIGHSSTALFEAIIAGVPTICTDPLNRCRPVCSYSIEAPLYRGDREAWLHQMSYTQFSLSEIADGNAWKQLEAVM